jgi:virginiamycin B lyase
VATLTLGPATTPVTQGTAPPPVAAPPTIVLKEFPVPAGSAPHDVAPAADGGVWFTAQRSGQLGWLDPKTGQTKMIRLGAGSAPHGVITDQNGIAWVTDSGLNAIVSVDPRANDKVTVYKIQGPNVNLNTAVIDRDGVIWFTGQAGYIGRLVPFGLEPMPEIQPAPRGAGPYGITSAPPTPSLPGGGVYYASLAGDHIARVIPTRGAGPAPAFRAQSIDPPTQSAGPRRVWSDSKGVIWVSEWNAGQLGRYDPATQQWKEWKLPGTRPQAYAVFVDDRDIVWLTDFGASAIVRFDPATERSDVFPHAPGGNVRQLHGRPGEVWGALSALDKLLLVTTR